MVFGFGFLRLLQYFQNLTNPCLSNCGVCGLGVVIIICKVGDMREELIQAEPSIMMGKPVIAGTRITVELILEKMAAGETIEQLLDAHPRLTREAVQAALAFAARALRADIVYPLKQTPGHEFSGR
jgi:uncharacterized protein (DUF433 family)